MIFTSPIAEFVLAIVFFIVVLMYISIMYIKEIVGILTKLIR